MDRPILSLAAQTLYRSPSIGADWITLPKRRMTARSNNTIGKTTNSPKASNQGVAATRKISRLFPKVANADQDLDQLSLMRPPNSGACGGR